MKEFSQSQIQLRSVLIMITIALSVLLSSVYVLYNKSYEQHKIQLIELVDSQARLMESVAKYNAYFTGSGVKGASKVATLSQIKEAQKLSKGFGKSGELVMAHKVNTEIVFLMPSKKIVDPSGKIEFVVPDPIPFDSELGMPMQLALTSLKRGFVESLDHSGNRVVAAYTYLPFLELGIVAKMNKNEFMRPFIEACLLASLIALVFILLGAYLVKKSLSPIVSQIYNHAAELKKLTVAVEQSPALVLLTDEKGNLEYVNQSFIETTGYPRDEVLGKNTRFLKGNDCDDAVYKELWSKISQGESWFGEFQNVKKNGDLFWAKASIVPITDDQGNIKNYLCHQEDVTVQRSEEKRFRALLESAPEAMVIVDDQRKILLINEKLEKVFGYSKDELIGQTIEMLIPEEYHEKHPEQFSSYTHNPNVRPMGISLELKGRHKEGQTFDAEVSLSPIETDLGLIIVSSIRDITQRLENEKLLRNAKENAEQATKAKNDFLANVSHEIRTPMNAILGMSYLALKTELNHKQKNYIKKVQESGEALQTIIEGILDFSKIESGEMEIYNVDFSLKNVMQKFENIMNMKTKEKSLVLSFNWDENIPNAMIGDPNRIAQVLNNLGDNAVKFTDKGTVEVSVKLIEKDSDFAQFQICISDTGIGMTKELQDNLFTSFTQGDASSTRKFGGTGIGLSISKNLIEMMDGSINFKSEFEKGSEFCVELKLKISDVVIEEKSAVVRSEPIVEKKEASSPLVEEQIQTEKPLVNFSIVNFKKDFNKLIVLCDNFDTAAIELSEQLHKTSILSDYEVQLKKIMDHVHAYEFEEAKEIIEKLLSS